MFKSELAKLIKADIRANQRIVYEFVEGGISYGVMAERLATSILTLLEKENIIREHETDGHDIYANLYFKE